MADVIDINAERDKREAPDAEFRKHDDFGREMFTFLLNYEMGDGSRWSVELWAYSAEDAQNRVDAMRGSLTVCGQVYTVVEA